MARDMTPDDLICYWCEGYNPYRFFLCRNCRIYLQHNHPALMMPSPEANAEAIHETGRIHRAKAARSSRYRH